MSIYVYDDNDNDDDIHEDSSNIKSEHHHICWSSVNLSNNDDFIYIEIDSLNLDYYYYITFVFNISEL